jgi:AcrR family transcriptional regulator
MAHRTAAAQRTTSLIRPQRDKSSTRQHLLETAGLVFAEHGFNRVTGKEICERADVNTAAVNYYFGGMEGLYAAVLAEAQSRLITFDALNEAIAGKTSAKDKLRAIITLILRTLTGPVSTSWVFRVIGREFVAPSPAWDALRRKDFLLRAGLLKAIVGELLGQPPDHPYVAQACISMIAPFTMLAIVDRNSLRSAFPSLRMVPENADALADNMLSYTMAGLSAIRRGLRNNG